MTAAPINPARRPDSDGRIPVATAKRVAEEHGLIQCLLIGWDGDLAHVVTYGVNAEECRRAARAQEFWQGAIREFSFRDEPDIWVPIASLPDDDTLVIAFVPDGRMMIWKASLLRQALSPDAPQHLRFPATHYRAMPRPPAVR